MPRTSVTTRPNAARGPDSVSTRSGSLAETSARYDPITRRPSHPGRNSYPAERPKVRAGSIEYPPGSPLRKKGPPSCAEIVSKRSGTERM
ncbi:MAG: hypothetical protein FJY88_05185 [Candidatus Eisenbacteria bacterium]|nr:hypothetical protein [Candidatus Eisenbacteria bacterium]